MGFSIAAVFSNNMVLQKGKNIAVWGEGDDGAKVTADINGASAEAYVRGGKWQLTSAAVSRIWSLSCKTARAARRY